MNKIELKNKLLQINLCVDNEYLDKYVDLIISNLNTKHINFKTQRHHIIPAFYFENLNIEIDNSKENLVNLNYKFHILAHYYLALCSVDKYKVYANVCSMKFLENKEFDLTQLEQYQELYEIYSQIRFEKSHTLEAAEKVKKTVTTNKSKIAKVEKIKKPVPSKKQVNPKNQKLSDLASARTGEKNNFYGKTHSKQTKDIIALKNGIPVAMLDYTTKETLKEFISAKSAAEYLVQKGITINLNANHRILDVCKSNNLNNHAYGYSWKFIDKV